MTTYNSQHVNRDPYPYTTNGSWGGKPLRSDEPYFQGSYDPRPEFDNNPNPILEAYREIRAEDLEGAEQEATDPTAWLEAFLEWAGFDNQVHITHARKVLERLATL